MKRNKQTDGMSQKHVDEKEKMLKTELKNCPSQRGSRNHKKYRLKKERILK